MMDVKFHDGSAMVAGASCRPLPMVPNMTFGNSQPPSVSPGSKISGNRKCTYCNGTNHIREICFKLNGIQNGLFKKRKLKQRGIILDPRLITSLQALRLLFLLR